MEGLSKLALNTSARQEIVAGNLAPHVLSGKSYNGIFLTHQTNKNEP
jgi:hypothetical protein